MVFLANLVMRKYMVYQNNEKKYPIDEFSTDTLGEKLSIIDFEELKKGGTSVLI